MQKGLGLILLIVLLSISFVIAYSQTNMTMRLTYDSCIDRNGIANEQCFSYATPINVKDCELLQPDFNNYETLLLKCYSQIAIYNNTACDKLPLNDGNKQLCYVKAGVCNKIADSSQKDNCYNNKLDCTNIVDEGKKTVCTNALNQKNFSSTIGYLSVILVLLILVLFPIFVLAIIIKTIIDLFKKKTISLSSWAIRLGLILGLIIIWILIFLIMFFTAGPTIVY